MAYYYGIDLGTTNTVISCLRVIRRAMLLTPTDRCELNIVPIIYDKYRWDPVTRTYLDYETAVYQGAQVRGAEAGAQLSLPTSLPSVVYQHIPYGSDTATYLTGEAALKTYEQEHLAYPDRFFENTKSLMDQDVVYEQGSLTAADIAKHLLKTCFLSIKRYAESTSREPTAIGISYPAARNQMNYLKSLNDAAVEAAREVGLLGPNEARDFFCTTQEPYAALTSLILDECIRVNIGAQNLQLIQKESSECLNMMVVDVGGGTTDIAIQPIQQYSATAAHLPLYPEVCTRRSASAAQSFHSTNSAVNLNGDFGGSDFDTLLARKIARRMAELAGVAMDVNYMSAYVQNKALNIAREMKHRFSDDASLELYLNNVTAFFGPLDHMHDTALRITRSEYESWIRPYIYSTAGFYDEFDDYKRTKKDDVIYSIERIIDDTMAQAHCTDWNDIDCIFLTGGMSKMPQIRKMLSDKVSNTSCRIIISDERPPEPARSNSMLIDPMQGQFNSSLSPRFKDISFGVTIYACLNGGPDAGDAEVPGRNGRKYKDFIASPHSSVALLADVGEGLPHVLINHSQALPVENNIVEKVFTSRNTAGISVQMYTGLSAYDKGLKKLTRNSVSLEKHPPFPGTDISLIYSIGQDMHATLQVRYIDATNQERIKNMEEVFLNAATQAED